MAKSMIVTEEQKDITDAIMPSILEIAEEFDGLIQPDQQTVAIFHKCVGIGLSIGMMYTKTDKRLYWRDRLKDVFRRIEAVGEETSS